MFRQFRFVVVSQKMLVKFDNSLNISVILDFRRKWYGERIDCQSDTQSFFEKGGNVENWTDEQKAWYKRIQGAVKKYAWNGVKFINSEQKLVYVTGKIFDKWNLKEHEGLVGKDREEARSAWIAKNSDLVCMAFNDNRNYCQSQLRDSEKIQIQNILDNLINRFLDILNTNCQIQSFV